MFDEAIKVEVLFVIGQHALDDFDTYICNRY